MVAHGFVLVALWVVVVGVVFAVRVLAVDRGSLSIVLIDLHLLLLGEHELGEAGLVVSKVLGAMLVDDEVVVGIVVVVLTWVLQLLLQLLRGLALLNLPL